MIFIKLRNKPITGESKKIVEFICKGCGEILTAEENYSDHSDFGDGDCLDLRCSICGEYYKKMCRVYEFCIVIEEWYESI